MTTAAELIRDSYQIANILDPEEEVIGFYATTGLRVLNDIIAQWSSLPTYLQAYHVEEIDVEAGVFEYEVSATITQFLEGNLIDNQLVQSILKNVDLKRQNTFNYPLSETGQGRPTSVFIQNAIVNVPPPTIQVPSTVFFFPVPDQDYIATLYLKKVLTPLTQSGLITEISTAYFKPLKFQLAKDLSIEFSSVLPPRFDEEYERLMTELKAANKKDMTVQNSNPFSFHGRRYRPWSTYAG